MDMGPGFRLRNAAIYLVVAGAAVASAIPAGAQTQNSIDVFMAQIGDSMRAIPTRANGDAALVLAGCRDFLGRVLNLEKMAHAATEGAWNRMSVAQRESYQAAFADRLVSECARELADHKGEAIALAGIRSTTDGDKLATIRIGAAEGAKMIAWRLRKADADTWSAVDVIWEGHSAIAKARDEFAAGLQGANGDIDALIGLMRK
jgi:ABC-type transporter MlaC component